MANESMDKTTLWFIGGFIAVVVVGLLILGGISGSGSSTTSTSTSTGSDSGFTATTVAPIDSADWTIGNPQAKVTLIEYGDFECPACGAYYPIVQQIIGNYSSTILFAFRNYPLYTIHPDAGIAAEAAEAAGLQGKYWQMNDALYKNQAVWTDATPDVVLSQFFNGYASSIGLNVAKFDADISSSQVTNKIQNDVTSGNAAQIDHTPTFFINDTQIPNPTGLADFEATLNAAIASSTGVL